MHKNGKVRESSLDHLFTNDPSKVITTEKISIQFSDHSAITTDIETKLTKTRKPKIVSRDMRKLRSNPGKFVDELFKVDWSYINDHQEDVDVDLLEDFLHKESIGSFRQACPTQNKNCGKEEKGTNA